MQNSMDKQNISDLAIGLPFDDKDSNKKSGTTNSNELSNKLEEIDDDMNGKSSICVL